MDENVLMMRMIKKAKPACLAARAHIGRAAESE